MTNTIDAIRARQQQRSKHAGWMSEEGCDFVWWADGTFLCACASADDAPLVATAPTDIATLLAHIDALEARAERAEAALRMLAEVEKRPEAYQGAYTGGDWLLLDDVVRIAREALGEAYGDENTTA